MILKVWVEESEDNLRSLMRHEKDSNIKDKLNTLLLIKSNKVTEINEIVGLLNRHRNTISSWLNKYRNGGLEKLLFVKQREIFEPALINGNNLEKLKSRLLNPKGFSSYGEIKEWLKKQRDLYLNYSLVHYTVRYKLKSKLKIARPTNIKKGKEKAESFKKTLKIN